MNNLSFGDLFRLVARIYLAVIVLNICLAGIVGVFWLMVVLFMVQPGTAILLCIPVFGIPVLVVCVARH
jgi:hypothetical protein